MSDLQRQIDALQIRLSNLEKQSLRASIAENVERYEEADLPAAGQAAHIVFVTDVLGGLTYADNGTDWQAIITAPVDTVANLQAITPTGNMLAFASNGRKANETGENGTGIPVWYDVVSGFWRNFYDNQEMAE